MLELSPPAIIAQLVSIIHKMADRILIGRIENGTNAMAALSPPIVFAGFYRKRLADRP